MVVKRSSRSITSKTSQTNSTKALRSSRRSVDRNHKSLEFPAFDVKIEQISSTILLLQSDEADVIQKALSHLDNFASLGQPQLQILFENNLYDVIVKLCASDDSITKRSALKLLAELVTSVCECKEMFQNDDALIEAMKNVFTTSSDENLVEYSCILLQSTCDDPKQVDSLGRDKSVLQVMFKNLKSHDPNILLHSLRLLNVVMKNSMLIESILSLEDFPFTNLQIELNNEIDEIRATALESIFIIANFSKNPFWKSDQMIGEIESLCMQEESETLQKSALTVFKTLFKNEEVLMKISKSSCLVRFIGKFFENSVANRDSVLSVLMEFAKIDDNRKILCENGIVKETLKILKESGSIEAIEGIIVMSTNVFCLKEILSENVYAHLMDVAIDEKKKWEHRSLALTAFLNIINIQGFDKLMEISERIEADCSKILKTSKNVSFMMIGISILVKLAEYQEIKTAISTRTLSEAMFDAIREGRTTQLSVRLFNMAALFVDQENFRNTFIDSRAFGSISEELESPSSVLRSSVCNFISASACYPELCEILVRNGILKQLLSHFDCTLCSDAFETILNHDLSMKFLIRGHLGENDKIHSGFYAMRGKRFDCQCFCNIVSDDSVSPFYPVFTINFEKSQDDELKQGNRAIRQDKNLIDLINDLESKKDFKSAENQEKIKLLAFQVSKFLQSTDECICHQLQLHLTALKFKFSSSVIPLGSLIYGKSFEAALLFKALADQLEIGASLHSDESGKGWNRVCDETNVVDLIFDVGELYEMTSLAARHYFLKIS